MTHDHNRRCVRGSSTSSADFWGAWVLLAVACCVGCAKPTQGTVIGTVLVDGVPAKSGGVSFFPLDRKATPTGGDIVDGKFTAQAALGTCRVEIRVSKAVGTKPLYDTPDSPIQTILEESLPPKYNDESELTIDVHTGENSAEFNLSTKTK